MSLADNFVLIVFLWGGVHNRVFRFSCFTITAPIFFRQAKAWAQVEAARAVTAFDDVPFREAGEHLHALPLVIGLQEWPGRGTPREMVFVEVGGLWFLNCYSCQRLLAFMRAFCFP